MAGCDVLYYDPAHVDRNPAGQPLDPASDGWQPCRAPSHIWMDPSWSCGTSVFATTAS